MTRLISAALVAVLAVSATTEAQAMRSRGSDNAVSQQRAKLKKEWQRARAVGGYQNPLSALIDLIAGRELRPGTVQPSFQSSNAVHVDDIR